MLLVRRIYCEVYYVGLAAICCAIWKCRTKAFSVNKVICEVFFALVLVPDGNSKRTRLSNSW
uniref:Uncharacterized protein n=1 Tax=Arundo donax TaxID=35708 RepID=A0A0A9ADT4_ARUDO